MAYFELKKFRSDRPTLSHPDDRPHARRKPRDNPMQSPCKPTVSKLAIHVNQN